MTSVPPAQPPAAPESDEWPRPGLLGRVKCSDRVWRIAFCVLGRGGSPEWVFADGARRRVDTSTAHSLVADAELGPLRADLDATRERLRVVEGERDAARAGQRESWKYVCEIAGLIGVEPEDGHPMDAVDRLTARAESAEAAHEALRKGIEALDRSGRMRFDHSDLRALLAGGAS